MGFYFGIAALLAVLAFAWWFMRWAKRAGEDGQARKQAEAGNEHAREANRIREDVARLSDDQLADELRGDK